MITPEGKIAQHLLVRCKQYGFHQRKLAYEGRRGAPDRLILGHRCFALIELKAPGQKPRREQLREIEILKAGGVPVFVCDSKESVDEVFDDLRERSDGNRYFDEDGTLWQN